MLAFSIWNALWVVIVTFLFLSVLMVLFSIVADVLRDPELGGGTKALWIIVLVLIPLLGSLIYLLVRGQGMTERSIRAQRRSQEAFDEYVRGVAGGGVASELEKASTLHAAGELTDDEYAALKAKLLA
jgi:ABC-type multidrug transport system fused ATPase/permease subunit